MELRLCGNFTSDLVWSSPPLTNINTRQGNGTYGSHVLVQKSTELVVAELTFKSSSVCLQIPFSFLVQRQNFLSTSRKPGTSVVLSLFSLQKSFTHALPEMCFVASQSTLTISTMVCWVYLQFGFFYTMPPLGEAYRFLARIRQNKETQRNMNYSWGIIPMIISEVLITTKLTWVIQGCSLENITVMVRS